MAKTYPFADRFADARILCVGDVMLDHFFNGTVTRISPEAPVPVFKLSDSIAMAGGAANTAANMAALGAQVSLVAPVGDDASGRELRARLAEMGRITLTGPDDPRGTIVKSRYSAQGQQLLRIDHEDLSPLPEEATRGLIAAALAALEDANLVVLSDYAKGALGIEVCRAVIAEARSRAIPVVVDPKGTDFSKYDGASVITPNENELATVLGGAPVDDEAQIEAARALALKHDLGHVALTRGKAGVMLVNRDALVDLVPSFALDVFDVSGAGDTFVAGLSCTLAAGEDMTHAVQYGNAAAGVAVGKPGTAIVTPKEVERLTHLRGRDEHGSIVTDFAELAALAETWREAGERVGFTNGVFDLLHLGHLQSLRTAKAECDRLIVAVNSDASVKRLKGPTRPIQTDQVRAEVLASMGLVDAVVIFDADTPYDAIVAAQPDLLVKGGDYRPEDVVGGDVVTARGGRVMIVPTLAGYSTTNTVSRMTGGDG